MIITKLKGGLGNQMFQYATGFSLALKNKTQHKIDISTYDNQTRDTPRKFALNVFTITSPIALSEEIKSVTHFNIFEKCTNYINQKIFRNFYTDFHPTLFTKIERKLQSGQSVYLDGNFQSEKNFIEYSTQVKSEFTFKKEFFSDKVKDFSEVMNKEESVSIHIRRGDYVQDPKTHTYHGVCPISYYLEAVKQIKHKITNPTFYIFTDDPQWVQDNAAQLPSHINISKHFLKDHEEMFLMTQCKHNIIANSSFSWWGAWLNKNSDKIVIAPTQWVKKQPNPHPNIIPTAWIKI